MKATEAKLLDFLKKSPQFLIPIYQRTYSWTEKECRQLWDDIIRTGSKDAVSAHFVGSIVYIEIEHILPQNVNLSANWKSALGPEWERIQQTWLHTLGNLTLTGYNSEYSDRVFQEKRDMKGGFKESPLKLNGGLGLLYKWNEDAIKTRASRLADMALQVWAAPKLADDILETYRPKVAAAVGYTIDDHPHLLAPNLREVFEAFRKEVLALDPCVVEEFLKRYVAYKAETNFVDVVPQAKRLRLSLNIAFAEISDPKGLSKDVAGLGRWGNGDVEVGLTSIDELPYVMGLVRQALEQQMGNGV